MRKFFQSELDKGGLIEFKYEDIEDIDIKSGFIKFKNLKFKIDEIDTNLRSSTTLYTDLYDNRIKPILHNLLIEEKKGYKCAYLNSKGKEALLKKCTLEELDEKGLVFKTVASLSRSFPIATKNFLEGFKEYIVLGDSKWIKLLGEEAKEENTEIVKTYDLTNKERKGKYLYWRNLPTISSWDSHYLSCSHHNREHKKIRVYLVFCRCLISNDILVEPRR